MRDDISRMYLLQHQTTASHQRPLVLCDESYCDLFTVSVHLHTNSFSRPLTRQLLQVSRRQLYVNIGIPAQPASDPSSQHSAVKPDVCIQCCGRHRLHNLPDDSLAETRLQAGTKCIARLGRSRRMNLSAKNESANS
jgi:hypothetical protein